MSFWSAVLPASIALGLALAACGSDDIEVELVPAVVETPVPEAGPEPQKVPAVDAGRDSDSPSCLDKLRASGVAFEPTVARGVVDAVTVKGPIAGVSFTSGDTTAISKAPMACAFVQTLERFATYLKSKGVVRVGTLGSYCYRCCCAWSPTNDCRSPDDPEPNCDSYSNHSWGRALDVRYIELQSGAVYDIKDAAQWVIGSSSTTCTTGVAKQKGVSKILYGYACDVAAQGIFATVLTPNYNAAHRDHWHMDIGEPDIGPPWTTVVRSSTGSKPTPVDVGNGDVCGSGGD